MFKLGVLSAGVRAVSQCLAITCQRTISQFSSSVLSPGLGIHSVGSTGMTTSLALGTNSCLVNRLAAFGLLGSQPTRSTVRVHFPRPSEIKRIRKHGWKTRMSTKAGREIIMRRILKGRHVLSH